MSIVISFFQRIVLMSHNSFLSIPIFKKINGIGNVQLSGLELLMEEIQARMFDGPGRVNHGRRFTLLGDGVFRHMANGNSCIKSYHFPAPAVPLEQ